MRGGSCIHGGGFVLKLHHSPARQDESHSDSMVSSLKARREGACMPQSSVPTVWPSSNCSVERGLGRDRSCKAVLAKCNIHPVPQKKGSSSSLGGVTWTIQCVPVVFGPEFDSLHFLTCLSTAGCGYNTVTLKSSRFPY